MKKSFGVYGIIWAIYLAVFNVIVFVTPSEIGGASKFEYSFWVGYIFITIAFLGQLACAFVTFKSENLKKLFYNIPLLSISYGGLVAMLIVGSIFMTIPVLSEWIAIIVCVIILAFNAVAIIKATAVAGTVSGIDKKIKAEAFFIKSLAVEAQDLITSAKNDELRDEAKKVYEEIRYSDPVAKEELSEIDFRIQRQFVAFSDAIKTEDVELAKEMANVLIEIIKTRNGKCKLLK